MYEIHSPSDNTKVITRLFKRLTKTARPKKAKQYLQSKGFLPHDENIGFIPKNYPGRRAKKLIEICGRHALLQPLARDGCTLWHEDSIVFPLRNKQGKICGLYGQSIANKNQGEPQYLSNRQGLYPGYPSPAIPVLLLTMNVMEAARLCQHPEAGKKYNVLGLCGSQGLTPEHEAAIVCWATELTWGNKHFVSIPPIEILFSFDPMKAATPLLQQLPNKIKQLLANVPSF